ncbi:unnamed protein product [Rhizophagus irregularis]|nr:unnamed protein product [Rhizophagus irregularis]
MKTQRFVRAGFQRMKTQRFVQVRVGFRVKKPRFVNFGYASDLWEKKNQDLWASEEQKKTKIHNFSGFPKDQDS